jgi:activating signal cointegrator complex subunit 3
VKGTEIYNPEKGGFTDLSILDVQQIFGRAGRPQFDSSGEATLITTHDAFPRYMDLLVRAVPIESNFIKQLVDHLNAEIVGGTVTNVEEAAEWLTYTYLYVRMVKNPLAYGISADQMSDDPLLRARCRELVVDAAKTLDRSKMINFHPETGQFSVAERGRVAAHFYIQAESIASFDELLDLGPSPSDASLLRVVCAATEFTNMRLRQEEMPELEGFRKSVPMKLEGPGGDETGHSIVTDSSDKVFILMQAYISREKIRSFTLISDTNYVSANAGRVSRALFEICLRQNLALHALKFLRIAKSVENQIWWFQTPLRHFSGELTENVYVALEQRRRGNDTLGMLLQLLDMQPAEVGQLCRWSQGGLTIQRYVALVPTLDVSFTVKPVSGNIVTLGIHLTPTFEWHARWHGGAQSFWLWISDDSGNKIYHHEQILFLKRTFPDSIELRVTIPIFSSPVDYVIHVVSEAWVGIEFVVPVYLKDLNLPSEKNIETDLYDLSPLPISALRNPQYEQLYSKIDTFNPVCGFVCLAN